MINVLLLKYLACKVNCCGYLFVAREQYILVLVDPVHTVIQRGRRVGELVRIDKKDLR